MNWPVRICRSRNLTRVYISPVKQVRQTPNADQISIITQGRFTSKSSRTSLLVRPASQNNGNVLFTCTNFNCLHFTSLEMPYSCAMKRYFALRLTRVVKYTQWSHKLFMAPLQLMILHVYRHWWCNTFKLTLLYHSTDSYNVG